MTIPFVLTYSFPAAFRRTASFFMAACAGDAAAKAVFDTYIEHLSSACASVYNILDPEVLAIGGGLSAAGPFLFDPLQEKVSKKCFYATRGKLVPAVLGNEAGMVGAALLARDAKV